MEIFWKDGFPKDENPSFPLGKRLKPFPAWQNSAMTEFFQHRCFRKVENIFVLSKFYSGKF